MRVYNTPSSLFARQYGTAPGSQDAADEFLSASRQAFGIPDPAPPSDGLLVAYSNSSKDAKEEAARVIREAVKASNDMVYGMDLEIAPDALLFIADLLGGG